MTRLTNLTHEDIYKSHMQRKHLHHVPQVGKIKIRARVRTLCAGASHHSSAGQKSLRAIETMSKLRFQGASQHCILVQACLLGCSNALTLAKQRYSPFTAQASVPLEFKVQ